MQTGIAKENSGRIPTYRKEPDVNGGFVRYGKPYEQINFIRIVPGSRIVTNAWIEVEEGVFVNFKLNNKQYYDIIKLPEGDTLPTYPDLNVNINIYDGKITVSVNNKQFTENES